MVGVACPSRICELWRRRQESIEASTLTSADVAERSLVHLFQKFLARVRGSGSPRVADGKRIWKGCKDGSSSLKRDAEEVRLLEF